MESGGAPKNQAPGGEQPNRKKKNSKIRGRRRYDVTMKDKDTKQQNNLRGRRHFRKGSDDEVDLPAVQAKLSMGTKADIMIESTSNLDPNLLRLFEDDDDVSPSAMNLGVGPTTFSSSEGSGVDASAMYAIAPHRPDDNLRTAPAKETALWERHPHKIGKVPHHPAMSLGPGSSPAMTARLRIGAGGSSSKGFSRKSIKSTSYRQRQAVTAAKQDRGRAAIDFEWFWYERTSRERVTIMIFLGLFFLALAHFIVAVYFIYSGLIYDVDYEECTNSTCVAFAKFITSRMDSSVKPCDDFYTHVCGTKTLPEDEQYLLQKQINFRHFTIPFDFTKSEPLGAYMQTAANYGVKFMLDYYKACMDRRRRETEAFNSFRQVLQRVNLDSASGLQSAGVQGLLTTWLQNNLAKALFSFEYIPGSAIRIYMASCGNVECRFMTRTFATYKAVIVKALTLARTTLDISTDAEISDIANDVICTEVRLQRNRMAPGETQSYTENYLNQQLDSTCQQNQTAFADKMNGYGGQNSDWGTGSWVKVVCDAMGDALGGQPCSSSADTVGNTAYFDALSAYLTESNGYRFGRFLQWIAYRELSADLTVEVFNLFYDWKVDDYRLWDFYCFERLFRSVPAIPTNHYVTANKDEKAFSLGDQTSRRIDTGLGTMLLEVPIPSGLGGVNPNVVKANLIDLFWSDTITILSAIRAKWIKTLAFYTVDETKKMNRTMSHVVGIADILNLQGRLQRLNFVSLGNGIPNFIFQADQQRSVYAFHGRFGGIQDRTVLPPFGLGEQPIFRYGLHALDLGGYGSYLAQEKVKFIFNWIMTDQWMNVPQIDGFLQNILTSYKNVITAKLNVSNDEVMKWGKNLQRSDFKNVRLIANQFALEVAWRVLQEVLDSDGIGNDLISIRGLDKVYTFQQLFFLQYTRVRCVNLNQTELQDSMIIPTYTPWKIMVNAALANTKAFGDTWNCGPKSKMRSNMKMNFLTRV